MDNRKRGLVLIRAIKLKNCVPYQQAELSDCKKINFVFGANGSGKSTISAFLSGSSDTRFSHSTIVWDNTVHETIYVYNRSFRRSNFQQTIPGVFTMGGATIDDINELERLKQELEQKKGDWDKRCESYNTKMLVDIPAREKKFRDDAWDQILKANETVFQKTFEGLRGSKDKFVSTLKKRIEGIPGHEGLICDRTDLLSRAKTLYGSKPERCSRFTLNIKEWLDKVEEIRTNPIWDMVIAGNKDIDIAALIDELGNSPWVDQGRQYIRPSSKKCPFCQQETLTDEFKAKLESFFDKEYKSRVAEMEHFLAEYQDASGHIIAAIEETAHNEVAVNIGRLDTDIYFAKMNLLSTMYSDHEKKIAEKIKEPGIKIAIPDVSSAIEEITGLLNTANTRIDAHNNLVGERDTEATRLADDVWATLIHDSEPLIRAYQTDISNLNKAATGIKRGRDSKRTEIDELEATVIEKGKNITSVQPTIDEINRSLQAYGFTNFSIQPAAGHENYYCIKREDGTSATDTLSEGEETFLTFLYFMQWTKGSTDPEHVADKKIIVLDDPISSLDSTILYIVGAMVKDLSSKIRRGEGDVNQLFVLTHNVFFHKEASFINGRTDEFGEVNYWIVRKDDGISKIMAYGIKNPISTSYELLWQELRDNENLTRITVQNTMRRIIENYFGMLGKGIGDSLVNCFTEPEDQMIARSLIAWINDGSHSIPDDLYIDSYTDAVPKYKEVFKRMFYESGHKAHYDMMMKISDEPNEAEV